MKNIKKIAQIIIYLLVLYFIAGIIYKNWREVSGAIENINYGWLLLSLIIITINLTFQSYIWHLLLKHSHKRLPFKESFVTYFKSVITRYLPGGIWVFFARTYITMKLGFSKSQILFLITIESIMAVLSGGIIFLVIQPPTDYLVYLNLMLTIVIIVMAVLLALPRHFKKLFEMVFKRELSIVLLPIKVLITLIIIFIIHWFITGLALYCLINAFTAFSVAGILTLSGYFAVSWIIGFLFLIAPSGLGVREAVLIILLSPIIGISPATIISLLSRILFIFGELINFLISLSIKITPLLPNKKNYTPPDSSERET